MADAFYHAYLVRCDLLALACHHLRQADLVPCPAAANRHLRNAWAILGVPL